MPSTTTKDRVDIMREKEDALLGPPSKTMDAGKEAQAIVYMVKRYIQLGLGKWKGLNNLKATQMITRCGPNDGTMYYVKVQTSLSDFPWIFVKIWLPALVTPISKVTFKDMKKMKEEYQLVTF